MIEAITIPCFGDKPVVTKVSSKGSPLTLFVYNGRTFATELFKMHDQVGFSLADSLAECKERGWHPCTDQFIADALRAGWTRDKAVKVIADARADSGVF